MLFESFQDIMDYAIGKEIEAAEFYEDASRQENYAGASETFAAFAEEERKHKKLLENFKKENLGHYKIEPVPDLKRSDYLVDLQFQPGMSYADILRLAMKREEKALKFYADFSQRARAAEHKKVFEILAQEESKHKLKLETMYDDYMAELGD